MESSQGTWLSSDSNGTMRPEEPLGACLAHPGEHAWVKVGSVDHCVRGQCSEAGGQTPRTGSDLYDDPRCRRPERAPHLSGPEGVEPSGIVEDGVPGWVELVRGHRSG